MQELRQIALAGGQLTKAHKVTIVNWRHQANSDYLSAAQNPIPCQATKKNGVLFLENYWPLLHPQEAPQQAPQMEVFGDPDP